MKLTVEQRPDDSSLIASWSAVFEAPGGTVGRSADNHLVLPDPANDICRIQAAVRISNDACYLVNLSSMSSVSINGRSIQRDQEVPLAVGDQLTIGAYTLRAEDPLARPAESIPALAAGFATLPDTEPDPLLAEPDPLLDSPLIEPPAATAPAIAPQAQPASSAPIAASNPAPAADITTETVSPVPVATQTPQTEVEPEGISPWGSEADAAQTSTPQTFTDTTPVPETAAADADTEPFDEPLGAPSSSGSSDIDVFSDLFGPGTLPVGSVPDVSAHPFDMESAQNRNPEDPLRHLPRGDANVSGPARDPLDLLDTHEGDDVQHVFSDQTPSTLPSHDPLAPHRQDPVSEALRGVQEDDNQGWAARDHLREYGGYLRPARVQQPSSKPDDTDLKETDTPRRK